jgi:pyruvate/2-oxoglutarate dehydrogenase complex dihydrolipoamide acyltransferase (E2) component
MQTSKAIFNVPSPACGMIKEILVSEGDVVKVGDTLCLIE